MFHFLSNVNMQAESHVAIFHPRVAFYRIAPCLNTFKYGTRLVQAFGSQPLHHKYATTLPQTRNLFLLNSSKFVSAVSATLEISATRNMKSRLAIKFSTPPLLWYILMQFIKISWQDVICLRIDILIFYWYLGEQ